MSMSKKDFIALADALRGVSISVELIDALCQFMRRQNANFKEDRWRDYLMGVCGPNGGAIKKTQSDLTMERLAREDEQARNSAKRAPKTGQSCPHKSPIERDNCPQCEGTGQRIDFTAIRNSRAK